MRLPLIALSLLALPGGALAQRPAQAPPVRPAQAPPVRVTGSWLPHLPPAGNCKCGCVETGKCNCPDCDHPFGPSPCPPAPNCQCGCTVTGQCTCKNCDHPALHKPAKKIKTDPAAHKPLKKAAPRRTVQVCGPDGQCREVPAEVWQAAKKPKRSNRGPATYNAPLPLVQPPAMMAPTGHATFFMGRPTGGG